MTNAGGTMTATTKGLKRPTPITKEGADVARYDGPEIGAYRAAMGVTQGELAGALRVSQALVHHYESGRPVIKDSWGKDMIDAIDRIAASRIKLAAKGVAKLEEIRAAR
jgi:DNA-binding transcriptional regulator YiaG